MGILIQTQIENVSTRKDRTLKITFGTQELSPDKMAELMQMNQSLCHVYINSTGITPEQLSIIDNSEIEMIQATGKTQSQRMRNVFYKLWQQNNEGYKNANDYYVAKMDYVIEFYKKKIV